MINKLEFDIFIINFIKLLYIFNKNNYFVQTKIYI